MKCLLDNIDNWNKSKLQHQNFITATKSVNSRNLALAFAESFKTMGIRSEQIKSEIGKFIHKFPIQINTMDWQLDSTDIPKLSKEAFG